MNTNYAFNLIPADSHKSFYGKAVVIVDGNDVLLKSYNTIVAKIRNGEFIRTWGGWSATTARHVNSFRIKYGFAPISKGEWSKLPVGG